MKTTCSHCHSLFAPSAPNQIYCSARCRETSYRRRARRRSQLLSPRSKDRVTAVFNRVPTPDEEESIFRQLLDNPLTPPFIVPRPSSSRVEVPPGLTYHEEYDPDKSEFCYFIEWDRQLIAEYRSDPDSTIEQLIAFYGLGVSRPLPIKDRDRAATVDIFTKAQEHRQTDALTVLNKHLK